MYESSANLKVQKYLDCVLLIDPVYPKGHILYYNFLYLLSIRFKITQVGLLSVVVSLCNSYVDHVTLKL